MSISKISKINYNENTDLNFQVLVITGDIIKVKIIRLNPQQSVNLSDPIYGG